MIFEEQEESVLLSTDFISFIVLNLKIELQFLILILILKIDFIMEDMSTELRTVFEPMVVDILK